MNNSKYEILEPSFTQSLGLQKLEFNASSPVSLLATTSFLYTVAIAIIFVVAGFKYMEAGVWRIQASEAAVTKSNKAIRRVTLGLLGVLAIPLIAFTFNRGLWKGDVGLEELGKTSRTSAITSGGLTGVVPTQSSNTSSRSCDTTQNTITKLSSPAGICGGTSCSALAGCAYQQYLPIIRSEASRQGVDEKLVIAIMCMESRGKADSKLSNTNGTYDCGLMQVNQPTSCDTASFDPAVNIAKGVAVLKRAVSSAGQIYENIPPLAGVGATYNCCSNGTVPNAASVDCNQAAGFPSSIPKWACPINPGTSQYNMCAVKAYGCQVNACVNVLSGADL